MILVLNGPFGVGKTTLAEAWVAAHSDWLLVDVEEVGQMLRRILGDHAPVDDFQDYPAWAPLVVATVREIYTQTGKSLVLPICISSCARFELIRTGMQAFELRTAFACLVADPEIIRERLRKRGDDAGSWPDARVDWLCDLNATGDWGRRLNATAPPKVLVAELSHWLTTPETTLRTTCVQ